MADRELGRSAVRGSIPTLSAVLDRMYPEEEAPAEHSAALEADGLAMELIAAAAGQSADPEPIDALVVDKGLGLTGVMSLLQKVASTSHRTPVVVWGASVSEAEALRMLQAGARGILPGAHRNPAHY